MQADHIHTVRKAAALRRRLRRVVFVLVTVAVFLGGLGLTGWVLARSRPSWWRPIDPASTELLGAAQRLENGAVTALYDRPADPAGATGTAGSPWVAAINQDDAVAWLNTRFPDWLRDAARLQSWPPEVREIVASFENGLVTLGVRLVSNSGAEQFFSLGIRPRIDAQGRLWTPAESLWIGNLPVPVGLVFTRSAQPGAQQGDAAQSAALLDARGKVPAPLRDLPELGALGRALAGSHPIVNDPVVKLGDGRAVRLLSVTTDKGRLLLTCRTSATPR